MRKLTLVLALTLAPQAFAQTQPGPSFGTATDYSVLAIAPAGPSLDGVAAATPIGRGGLAIAARTGDRRAASGASTQVQAISDPTYGLGLQIDENGQASSQDANSAAQAGTSSSARPGTTPPSFGPHGLRAAYPVRPGATGLVVIQLQGRASTNAHCAAFVDVDGDGQPDWRGAVDGTLQGARIPVTAGRNGVVLGIVTDGRAGVRGVGQEGYGASLRVYFRPDPGTPTCTWTTVSRPCGANLVGTANPATGGVRIQLDVTGAPANALGVLVVGALLPAPTPLPFSRCDLLVDPRIALGLVTDANGAATVPFGIHAQLAGLDVNFQAVVLGFDPANAPTIVASNTENLTCQ
ncbi:MAG: hypothetical protein JNM84_18595 [Planctomycetes bacterium]|nr:hypothetical protein [Planctomycetota bacterium]